MVGAEWRRVVAWTKLLFTDPVPEVARLKRNWWIVHLISFVGGYSWTVMYSSLHQFVTTPTSIGEEDSIQPGLGLDDGYYAWVVAVFSIGELFSALGVGVLAKYFRIKTLMLGCILSLLVGSLLYGTGVHGAMLIVGRILQGVYSGGGSTLMRMYIGETSNIAISLKGEDTKSQIKNTNFFLTFGLGTLGTAIGPGSAAIVVQISSIDQFRWGGWVLVTASLFVLTITAIYFVELPTDINRKGSQLSLKSLKPAIPLYCLGFFVISFFAINFQYAVIEALINPILADNFGFSLRFISYVFVLTIAMYFVATVTIFVLQRVGLSNKTICIIGLMCGVSGCLVATDWQSLGGDPCDQYSYDKFNSSSYILDHPYFQEDTHANVSSWEGLCPSNSTEVCLSMEVCLNHSGPPEECFWNQQSRISGIFCEECEKLCRSWSTSLNFVQFLVGLLPFTLAAPITRITLTILTSDGMGSAGQSLIMGVIVASGSVSKIVGPPIGDALMLSAGRRTYLVMLPMMGMLAAVFVGFLVLYRKLSPRTRRSPEQQKWSSEATLTVETSEFLNSSIMGSEENLESVVEESEL